jgi:hypothetical protein
MGRVRAFAAIAVLAPACAAASVHGDGAAPRAIKVCAAAGPYWPTMTLALHRSSAWLACKEQSRVVCVSTRTGKTTKSVRLGGLAIAVKSGFGSIWALDDSGTLYRVDPARGRITRRISLRVAAAYNIWIGGGSVWVADDQSARVVRVSPRSNRVAARIAVGDGPASMAFDAGSAWVINHRDTSIDRVDLTSNRSTLLTTLGGDRAPERMLWLNGSLWVTGRGTDLLKVDPADGSVEQTIDVGGSGIDLVAAGDSIWVPARSAEGDPSGLPTMAQLERVSVSTGAVTAVATPARGRVDVHGLATAGGVVWIADNRRGYLYRVSAG